MGMGWVSFATADFININKQSTATRATDEFSVKCGLPNTMHIHVIYQWNGLDLTNQNPLNV